MHLNGAVDSHLASLGPGGLRAAEISGDAHAGRGWREYASLMYPEFDICAPARPSRAASTSSSASRFSSTSRTRGPRPRTSGELCAPGGHVVVSTPFLIRIHELPAFDMRDYWRFTPRGLRTLLEGAGLEVERGSSWGNRDCVVGNFDRWPAYRWWHSLRNEPDLPVQVWAFAAPAVARAPPRSGAPRG